MKKKPAAILLLGIALLSGGCNFGLPISPLMFLIKDDPAPMQQATPDNLTQPGPAVSPATTTTNDGALAPS